MQMPSLFRKIFRFKTINYVSGIDKFLTEWEKTHTPTASQQAEMNKYKRIYALRGPVPKKNN